jgi:hypothetical protein
MMPLAALVAVVVKPGADRMELLSHRIKALSKASPRPVDVNDASMIPNPANCLQVPR